MRISSFGRYALGFCAAFAILAGCGNGAQSQLAPTAPFQQSNAQSQLGQLPEGLVNTAMSGAARGGLVALHPDHGPSWMAPEAKAQNLLYLTNYGANNVLVFSYPQDKLVGTLTGPFNLPDGDCTDKKGDVWIVNNVFEGIVEYKHGGTSPIATLQDPGYYANSCVVDPTTGNLIVTNHQTYSGSGPGNVAIYTHAKGNAKLYPVAGVSFVYFCAFDDKGNLYVDGLTSGGAGFQLAELPKGKKTFADIPLKGGTINFPGNIQWVGKYMAVGDQEYQISPETSAIYQTTGAGGKIVGVTRLKGSIDVIGFWIDGTTVIGPEGGTNLVPFYKYPAGGSPIKTLKNKAFNGPFTAAISLAK